MPKLSALLSDRAEATVAFSGASVAVVYRPSLYTRELEAKLERIQELGLRVNAGEDVSAEMVGSEEFLTRDWYDQTLSDFLVGWDLTDEDDEPIALTPDALNAKVPSPILIAFVMKLVQAVSGEAAAGRKQTQTAQPTPLPQNRAERRAVPSRKK